MPEYECAYCGLRGSASDDHIPPKTFFIGPTALPLRSVKACEACNVGASTDDEYFRDTVLKYHRVGDLPQAQKLVEKMLRAIGLPAKAPYARATIKALRTVPIYTQDGVLEGTRDASVVDDDRLRRAAIRYARGLHRFEIGVRVPDDSSTLAVVNPDKVNAAAVGFEAWFKGGEARVIQEGVFQYAWKTHPSLTGASSWLLVFFDVFPVIVAFRPMTTVAPMNSREDR